MASGKNFDELRKLESSVLAEVVREGEIRVQAQLQIATAADQRALTLMGFQIATATAALGLGVTLMERDRPDWLMAGITFLFSLAMLAAAALLVMTIWPRPFAIPGNDPANWVPDEWQWRDKGFGIKAARVEQAACLSEMLEKNQLRAAWAARTLHLSLYVTGGTIGVASIALLTILAIRQTG